MLHRIIVSFLSIFLLNKACALTFDLPRTGNIIGELQTVTSRDYVPIADVGRSYDIGVYEMIEANPHVDPWAPDPGTQLVIPSRFILPSAPHTGIVINLAEMRLYYFHPKEAKVSTFPVGIGKLGWPTPVGTTKIIAKQEHPYWHVPKSIREGHAKNGRLLPTVVPPGPTNPLGEHALYLGFSGYLIHGTIHPGGIGMRSTHGCIRMHPADIEWLFRHVPVGTAVTIVHEPLKVALHGNDIILEAHLPLSDARYTGSNSVDILVVLVHKLIGGIATHVRWDRAEHLIRSGTGVPEIIGKLR